MITCIALIHIFVIHIFEVTSKVHSGTQSDYTNQTQKPTITYRAIQTKPTQKKNNTNQNIAIIMSDNRYISRNNYLYWSVAINYLYAQKHNCKFIFYKWIDINKSTRGDRFSVTCSHSLLGDRAAAWCKLISIYHALNHNINIQKVIFIDSDAVFVDHNQSVQQYLNNMDYIKYQNNATLIATRDYPFSKTNRAASGIMIFDRNDISNCILTEWWNQNASICTRMNMKHSWEQLCLSYVITQCYSKHISILKDESFVKNSNLTQFWRHFCHDARISGRRGVNLKNIYRGLILPNQYSILDILHEVKSKHTVVMHNTDDIRFQLEKPKEYCIDMRYNTYELPWDHNTTFDCKPY
eukprot:214894_1